MRKPYRYKLVQSPHHQDLFQEYEGLILQQPLQSSNIPAFFVWQYSAIRCSNSFVLGPVVIHPERRASTTSAISISEISGGLNEIVLFYKCSSYHNLCFLPFPHISCLFATKAVFSFPTKKGRALRHSLRHAKVAYPSHSLFSTTSSPTCVSTFRPNISISR